MGPTEGGTLQAGAVLAVLTGRWPGDMRTRAGVGSMVPQGEES